MTFFSQDKQDFYLEHTIFKGYTNGVYVDVGAHDGVTFSNSLYFDKYKHWKGICVEPLPEVYEKLCKSRNNSINLNLAIDNKNDIVDFVSNCGYTEMLSGIHAHLDTRHISRINRENNLTGSKTNIIKVKTKPLKDIFLEHDINHVNYLSIDVEGAEKQVIESIDFNKVFIDVIGFENNYPDVSVSIMEYLQNKNYKRLDYSGLDIMMINVNSQFFKNNA